MKNKRITIRLSDDEYNAIAAKAESAFMTESAYVRAAALKHHVTVVPGLKEVAHELKGIGRNLNQLTILSHEGKISTANLSEAYSALEKLYGQLSGLASMEKR